MREPRRGLPGGGAEEVAWPGRAGERRVAGWDNHWGRVDTYLGMPS